MPDERDIEKQLRAAAEQRRKQAGGRFELHPATRRLLQGEVARHRPASARQARGKNFLGLTWMRFATATCTMAILCLGTWSLLRNPSSPAKQQLTMADNKPAPKPASVAKMETAGYVQTAATAFARRDRSDATPLPAAPAPVLVTKADSVGKLLDEDGSVALEGLKKNTDATLALGATAAPAESKWREVDKLSVSRALVAAKDAEQSAVLANFKVTQSGDRIRIVDGDGSVYDGVLLAEEVSQKSKTLAADALRQENSQNFFFRAAGTNLSLRQNVAITGQFMNAVSPAAGAQNYLNSAQKQSVGQAGLMKNGVLISNGRIIGKAVMTDGREITLDAEAVSP